MPAGDIPQCIVCRKYFYMSENGLVQQTCNCSDEQIRIAFQGLLERLAEQLTLEKTRVQNEHDNGPKHYSIDAGDSLIEIPPDKK